MITLSEKEIASQSKLKKLKPLIYNKVIKYDEKLARGESVAQIQLQYNYVCNMQCIHCSISEFQTQNKSRTLTIADVKSIADQADALGLAHMVITGGEPTLFKDLDKIVEAIGPDRFWISCDSNGWLMNDKKAKYFKDIGIEKVHLSLDSLDEQAHDNFRKTPKSWRRAIESIDSMQKAGISVLINTVVTHQRAQTDEFLTFLKATHSKNVPVNICWAKPIGMWAGHYEGLVTRGDVNYVTKLGKLYNATDHTNQITFGRHIGCFAVKRMMSITQYGDAMPCPWMYFKLGNIFEMSLKDILEKGMKYFSHFEPSCLVGTNPEFIKKYISQTWGKEVPVPIEEILPLNWKTNE
jgi:MoaA/NifB/PqqE/SkfB family radical SAM enzyme